MKKRVITATVIGLLYLLTIFLCVYANKIFYDIFVLLVMITSGLEMSNALSRKFSRPIDVFIIIDVVLGYVAFYLVHAYFGGTGGITAYFGVLTIMFIACIIYNMFSKVKTIKNVISTMLVLIYPISIMIYMLGLNYIGSNYRVAAIFLLFFISCFADSFAFFVGSTVKGPKLCPSVSPKKTISGAVGGLIGGMLAGALILGFSLLGWFQIERLSSVMWLNVLHFLVIGGVGGIFTQVGDLIASYIKRATDIKDFGTVLPGHGGILDRMDGMMINAIFIFVYMMFLNIL